MIPLPLPLFTKVTSFARVPLLLWFWIHRFNVFPPPAGLEWMYNLENPTKQLNICILMFHIPSIICLTLSLSSTSATSTFLHYIHEPLFLLPGSSIFNIICTGPLLYRSTTTDFLIQYHNYTQLHLHQAQKTQERCHQRIKSTLKMVCIHLRH